MKAALALLLGLAFLAGAFAGGSAPARAQDLTGALGGELNVALQGFGSTVPALNPTTQNLADRKVLELIYDTLARVDPVTLDLAPWAATGWSWDGETNITVTLRTDLRWSDGTSYNAQDVAYALNNYQAPGNPTEDRWVAGSLDLYTLQFRFGGPAVAGRAGPGLFYTEGLTSFIAWDRSGVNKYSGPFSKVSQNATDLVLAANLYHFSGRPNLDQITYKYPYTLAYAANGTTQAKDVACAIMFREVNLIGWPLLANDLTNTRDCVAKHGGFPPLDATDSVFNLETVNITGAQVESVAVSVWCLRVGSVGVDVRTLIKTLGEAYAGASTFNCPNTATYGRTNATYTTNPATGDNWTQTEIDDLQAGCRDNDRTIWEVRCSAVRVDVNFVQPGPPPATLLPDGNGDTTGFVVSNSAGCTDEANEWTCVDDSPNDGNATYIQSKEGEKKTLLDPAKSLPFLTTAQNPGMDFLYFGFTFGANSIFTGPPGSPGQLLRSGIYQIVNKELYRQVEQCCQVTHSVITRLDTPWAPEDCQPWAPCVPAIEAGIVPAPAPVTRKTDTDPAAIALDQGGLLDRNGDGIRETPTGVPLAFRFITPDFALDARKTTTAEDMQRQLSIVQLGVTTEYHKTQANLTAAIAACTTGCMYVQRYSAATVLPDWLYAMPEILAANDPAVNTHLTLGANAWTQDTRVLHVGHVQHLIAVAADVLPVLAYDTLESYDSETFSGWVNTLGGVNNFWTFKNLRLPAIGSLTATVSIFPDASLGPGEVTNIQVQVLDTFGNAVSGAEAQFDVDVDVGGAIALIDAVTDGSGTLRATYTAPSTIATRLDQRITATVTKAQYTGAIASDSLTLQPPGLAPLQVSMARGLAEIPSGTSTTIIVVVEDASGNPVPGATVMLATDLPGARIAPASGTTDATGTFTATFNATVRQGVQYQVTADVSMAGYESASASVSQSVRPDLGTVPTRQEVRNVPGFEAAYAVGAVAVVFALVALARRRRED